MRVSATIFLAVFGVNQLVEVTDIIYIAKMKNFQGWFFFIAKLLNEKPHGENSSEIALVQVDTCGIYNV